MKNELDTSTESTIQFRSANLRMASSPFPTTLAQLTFRNDATTSLYRSIRDIQRSTLSILNRLRSIVQDAEYVQSIAQAYRLPLIANERCGSWYIEPRLKVGSAYFKSTDGHHGQWSFSLRRLNPQVLFIVGEHGGAIIVDSTRRGKNMPDAFSKTVPIWVAVINRSLFPERTEHHALQCPPAPDDLGRSEVSQIEARLEGFVTAFKELQLDLEELRGAVGKPLGIQWAINGYDRTEELDRGLKMRINNDDSVHKLILCSASKRVVGAEVSEGGYIQGAGDDSEAWSHDLTPQLFWQHNELLLEETTEEDLPAVIATLIAQEVTLSRNAPLRLVKQTSTLYIGPLCADVREFDLVIDCNARATGTSKAFLALGCREGKLGSRDLRDKLPAVNDFVRQALSNNSSRRILVTCSTCKDHSIGVALMLLVVFYNDGGEQEMRSQVSEVDKAFIKKRLAWISACLPDVNPSRTTLQSVNAFLMTRPCAPPPYRPLQTRRPSRSPKEDPRASMRRKE
jgi:tRNA A64-2'-O-ribosylphosphate transferase